MFNWHKTLLISVVVFAFSCKDQHATLFTEVSSDKTGISFSNDIKEDEHYNILTYEYLYNGGGVAIGDVNNDGLPDIMFTGNMVPNKLYLNKGNFQFEDITEKAGVKGRSKWKTGTALADVNGDGLLDIYVCYSGPGTDEERSNELYINQGIKDGVPVFTESAKAYGLDAPGTYTTTVSFFDMDNDGDLDMFMVNHADMFFNPFFNTDKLRATRHPKFGNRLYRNDGGHFTDISTAAGIHGSGLNFGLSVAISDLNDDGWADIYVTNDYDERDFMYLNNHDNTFREVLTKATGHISEFAMGSDVADYNNDDKPDLIVLDMLPEDNRRQKLLKGADTYDKYMLRYNSGFHKQQMRNTLQLNNGVDSSGTPIFSEVGQMAGVSNTDWSWSPLFADFDNDGWKDLFISNGILRDITNLDFVKYTSGYSAEYKKDTGDKFEMWKLIKDMPSTKLSNYLFRNNHDLSFADVTQAWGFSESAVSNGSAYADLDNDGDLDLVINHLNDKASVYKNNSAETTKNHYIKLKLKGSGLNALGIGAKVYVRTDSGSQMQEMYTTRGFQSSVEPVMHIGLGSDSLVRSIRIRWQDGKTSLLHNIKADTLLTVDENNTVAVDTAESINKATSVFYQDITASSGINFTHSQSSFVDFKISPLLPYQLSKVGPALAAGDANGDGLEDVFIGAATTQKSVLYLQTTDGHFITAASQPWQACDTITVTDALFFDADKDGDNDLYLVSGGADFYLHNRHYQDQFYENDGHGNFIKQESALPKETASGSCVRTADINKDGLPDLFVGGKLSPGLYPQPAESFVLINKSTKGKIAFEKDKRQQDPSLTHPGMVTDAAWTDLNKDGWEDLVVVGEFMPVTVFENHNGQLVNSTAKYGLAETDGWWCRLLADDIDNDGDTDLVVGNMGINTQFKATTKEPLSIVYGDFYNNGATDPVLCYFNGGKNYPYYTKDEMADQIPTIQKKFLRYTDYADATISDIFTQQQLDNAHTVFIRQLHSVVLKNNDNKSFSISALPNYAQLSAVQAIVEDDINKDGKKDILIAGNFYPMRVSLGPQDATIGMLLQGDGQGSFVARPYSKSGLAIPGDVRDIVKLKCGKSNLLIIAKNNGTVQVLKSVFNQ